MAHDIYFQNGKPAMMYVNEVPWHGLGTKLDKPPTSKEAINAAGLNWEVEKKPLFVRFGNDEEFFRKVNRVAIMPGNRMETPKCPVFGVVGEDYGIVQNSEAFSFFDPLIKETGIQYETAGALGEGERIWILARMPESFKVGKSDEIMKYLLLMNSHTGLSTVQIKLTPVRVVCQNTLNLALKEGETIRISHTPDVKKRLDEAREIMHKIIAKYGQIEKTFQRMSEIRCSIDDFQKYLDSFIQIPEQRDSDSNQKKAWCERIIAQRDCMKYFFEKESEQEFPDTKGTYWSAYNAVTYFSDYFLAQSAETYNSDISKIKNLSKIDLEKRLKRIWIGDVSNLKIKAFEAAQDILFNKKIPTAA
ncbi:MAG: DUF932 domain-containing protein [Candidatus Riflebacteria bacterium]|nr:DUF932 domain-containing protein [Candidatus Riflebacteria bacterium]